MDPVTRGQIKKLLAQRKVLVYAHIEQAKVDRDGGKVLCPKMDRLVNIYSKVLTDHPAPVTQGASQ